MGGGRGMINSLNWGKAVFFVFILAVTCLMLSCQKNEEGIKKDSRLKVITSLFPLYDFAGNVGRDKVNVSLLLPPGVEPHSFEPKPGDMMKLNKADVFIYTNKYMEPWVEKLLQKTKNQNLAVADASQGIAMMEETETEEHERGHGGKDPHIWLDFSDAMKMVDNIRDVFVSKDPENKNFYLKNAEDYKAKLKNLDQQFQKTLSGCEKRVLVHGGHFAFGYLARRYHLQYIAAYGFSPNAEPRPEDLLKVSKSLRKNGLKYIFYEELISPRVAETVAKETGVSLLLLYTGHNVDKEAFDRGVTFIALMQKNLEHLKAGLQCP
jgi:zinc transport system substrate-binding protein